MSKYAETILREYGVRRSAKEKERFRLYLMGTLRAMGYDPALQTRETPLQMGGNVTNVVAGDPEKAKLILVAHYDTSIKTLLPPLIMPTRPLTAFLYMALTPVLVLAGSFALSFALTFALNLPHVTLPLFLLFLLAALCYLRFGPSETQNADDNTSGVAALLETAATLTPRYRGAVAFAFLDGGFGGLAGAKGFRARYPSAKEKLVLNVSCVAAGDELLILPSRASRWNGDALDAMLESFDVGGTKPAYLKTDGLTYYPSDNRAFRNSFAVCACQKLRGFGRIIEPRKNQSITEDNLEILRKSLCKLSEKIFEI